MRCNSLRNHAENLVTREQVFQELTPFLLGYRRAYKPWLVGELLRAARANKLIQRVDSVGTLHPMLVRTEKERTRISNNAAHARVGDSIMLDHGLDNRMGFSSVDHLCKVDPRHAEYIVTWRERTVRKFVNRRKTNRRGVM